MQALFVVIFVVLVCKLVFFYKPKKSEKTPYTNQFS